MAAAPLTIEFLKSRRGKEKAIFQGFVYTLTKSSSEVQQWVCEMRGVCKARMHTRGDVIIKPTVLNNIYSSHTHGSDPVRIDMLKGYNKVKERSIDSEESTRVILSYCIEQMGASSVAQLPKLESVKRTIRTYKSRSEENCGNPTCAAEIIVPEKYKGNPQARTISTLRFGLWRRQSDDYLCCPKVFVASCRLENLVC